MDAHWTKLLEDMKARLRWEIDLIKADQDLPHPAPTRVWSDESRKRKSEQMKRWWAERKSKG